MPNSANYWIGRGELLYKIVSDIKKIISIFKKMHKNLHISQKKQYLCTTNVYFTYSKLANNTHMQIGYKGSEKINTNQINLQDYENYLIF